VIWPALVAIPLLAAYWLRIFGRFVDGDSERDHVDAVRLGLLGLALALLLAHAVVAAVAAAGLQQVLALPRPRRAR
jgi:Na+/proline symporter